MTKEIGWFLIKALISDEKSGDFGQNNGNLSITMSLGSIENRFWVRDKENGTSHYFMYKCKTQMFTGYLPIGGSSSKLIITAVT